MRIRIIRPGHSDIILLEGTVEFEYDKYSTIWDFKKEKV